MICLVVKIKKIVKRFLKVIIKETAAFYKLIFS